MVKYMDLYSHSHNRDKRENGTEWDPHIKSPGLGPGWDGLAKETTWALGRPGKPQDQREPGKGWDLSSIPLQTIVWHRAL